jgi:hypothetical protein
MPTFRNAPLIPVRIRPWELSLLVAYLEQRSKAESNIYLGGFLSYLARICDDSLKPVVPKIQYEHNHEQNEAFLEALLGGYNPFDAEVPPE